MGIQSYISPAGRVVLDRQDSAAYPSAGPLEFSAAAAGPFRSGTAVNEALACAASTTYTLIDSTSTATAGASTTAPSGPGVIDKVVIITSDQYVGHDGIVQVYVDDETTPRINCSIGSIFANSLQDLTATDSNYHNRMIGSICSNTTRFVAWMKYPIFFTRNVRITVTTPSNTGGGAAIWSSIKYRLGADLATSWRLNGYGLTFAQRITATPTDQRTRVVKFLELAAGQGISGVIANFTLCGYNATSFTWAENNIVVYQGSQPRNGTVAPYYNSSGTEDFFDNGFYWDLGVGNYGDVFVSRHDATAGNGDITINYDLLSSQHGIWFDDGCLMAWEQGLGSNPEGGNTLVNTQVSWHVLYYTVG